MATTWKEEMRTGDWGVDFLPCDPVSQTGDAQTRLHRLDHLPPGLLDQCWPVLRRSRPVGRLERIILTLGRG